MTGPVAAQRMRIAQSACDGFQKRTIHLVYQYLADFLNLLPVPARYDRIFYNHFVEQATFGACAGQLTQSGYMKQMIVFAQSDGRVHVFGWRHLQKMSDTIAGSATVRPVPVQLQSFSMPLSRRVAALIALTLMAGSLGGCGSISSFVAGSMGDYIPAWAGGLPADAPPRPGTPKYEEWLKQHPQQGQAAQGSSSGAPSSAEAIR